MRLHSSDPVEWKIAKDKSHDICWWVFQPEEGKWKSGDYKIKFTKKDPGITIMAFGAEMPEGADATPDLVKKLLDANN